MLLWRDLSVGEPALIYSLATVPPCKIFFLCYKRVLFYKPWNIRLFKTLSDILIVSNKAACRYFLSIYFGSVWISLYPFLLALKNFPFISVLSPFLQSFSIFFYFPLYQSLFRHCRVVIFLYTQTAEKNKV